MAEIVLRGADVPTQRMADVNGTAQLVALWLHDKSQQTQDTYEKDLRYFAAFMLGQKLDAVRLNDLDLRTLTLNDLQAYGDYLSTVVSARTGKPLSLEIQKRRLFVVKSLTRFGNEIGFLKYNVGKAIKPPKAKETLAERILTELEVATMIALTSSTRDKLLLRLLYATGARVGEVSILKWKDIKPNRDGQGQVTLYGKGDKTRVVIIPAGLYKDLSAFRNAAFNDSPVFVSRNKGALKIRQIENIIRIAGERAGITGCSPHWLRHSHASHSLDRGAPPQLVQHTLGHRSLDTTSKYSHARPNQSSSQYLPAF